ncbi:MAG: hypothetical protein GEU73_10135 [Chloroflexi bacterium]|nr:hypothetical protein [Chloroflexota bacterium]
MELGRFDEAREAYNHTLRVDPTNTIAQKNLQRLDKLMAESIAVDTPTVLDPNLFIAETGRATTTTLVQPATPELLAKMHAGDPVNLEVQENGVSVTGPAGEALGRIEPKLRQRLIRLVGMGNQYAAHVTAVDGESIKIIVRETRRDPSMGNRPSFPATGDTFRGYVRDSLLRYDEEEDDLDLDEVEREREPGAAGEDLLLSDLPGESPEEDDETS